MPAFGSADHRWLTVTRENVTVEALAPAIRWMAAGGIVLFPTDTFYGLAVDPSSADAVAALFDLKGRDPLMAIPLIAGSRADVERTAALTEHSRRLADAFWPGPLSLVLDAPASIASQVHGGRDTIAVRVPADAVAQLLAQGAGHLITATSANRSGAPPAARVDAVDEVARDARVFVIDGGVTPGGRPSTIVDARGAAPVLVRDGALAWDRVLESLHS